jgi:hypothetical protein
MTTTSSTIAATPLFSDWCVLTDTFSARFTFTGIWLSVEWLPRMPCNSAELQSIETAYREARDRFLADVSTRLHQSVLCIEVPPVR